MSDKTIDQFSEQLLQMIDDTLWNVQQTNRELEKLSQHIDNMIITQQARKRVVADTIISLTKLIK